MIDIQLDSVKKFRPNSKTEYRYISRARCAGFESVSDGDNIRKVCKMMVDSGILEDDVRVWRGDLLVFDSMPLSVWASGKFGTGDQPEHLRKDK